MRVAGLFSLLYLVVGVVVAAGQNYLSGISQIGDVAEAVLAVLVWPLLLFGVDINISGGPRVD